MPHSGLKPTTTDHISYPLFISDTSTPLDRGVFSSRELNPGEIVEISPVVLLALKTQPFPGMIRRLLYNWSQTQVALGFGSLYNYSDQPNLFFTRDTSSLTITFKALREIQAGEQLTISYDNLGPWKNPRKKSWFEIHKVEKIELNTGKKRKEKRRDDDRRN